MFTERLLCHFTILAHVLLTFHRDAIGDSNATWLVLRLSHCDWEAGDAIRLREMAPAQALGLLHRVEDECAS
jgi:hypothetical protein